MNSKEAIISVLNLKNGVGCSAITWNIAHTLDLDIYQHDKGMHHNFIKQRQIDSLNSDEQKLKDNMSNTINVHKINKKKFPSGIYDLGSDFNYPYVRQILNKSSCVVIPIELGAEVVLKSIATIQYIQNHTDCKIIVVFNKLDNADPVREKKYTTDAELLIEEQIDIDNIEFVYIRYSFSMFRYLTNGYFYLDNYLKFETTQKPISNFNLLRCLRYNTHTKQLDSNDINRASKASEEKNETVFFDNFRKYYDTYIEDIDINKSWDLKFISNNKKLLKDMLILSTKIKETYRDTWEDAIC
ncbi:hypothetical protein HOK00_04110 [bacterium]|jgi:hypothetical protein|nr:hypothetical protein [bacterium]